MNMNLMVLDTINAIIDWCTSLSMETSIQALTGLSSNALHVRGGTGVLHFALQLITFGSPLLAFDTCTTLHCVKMSADFEYNGQPYTELNPIAFKRLANAANVIE